MAKHIRIHIHVMRPTRDAGPAHDPSNGQFTSTGKTGAEHHAEMASRHEKAAASAKNENDRSVHTRGMNMHKNAIARPHPSATVAANAHSASVASGEARAPTFPKNNHIMGPTSIAGARFAPKPATKDADPSGIKRDADGKFATSSGGAAHHNAAAIEHRSQLTKKGFSHPDSDAHQQAALAHENARSELRKAHAREELGHKEVAESHRARAQEFATFAKLHEKRIAAPQGPNSGAANKLKAVDIPGGKKITYGPEHLSALKDVLPSERHPRLGNSGTTNISHEQHAVLMKRNPHL